MRAFIDPLIESMFLDKGFGYVKGISNTDKLAFARLSDEQKAQWIAQSIGIRIVAIVPNEIEGLEEFDSELSKYYILTSEKKWAPACGSGFAIGIIITVGGYCINNVVIPSVLWDQSKKVFQKLWDALYRLYQRNDDNLEVEMMEFRFNECDCFVDGNRTDAIGLFKSENKDTFIQINAIDGGFSIESLSGININKLDKGCLIFNIHKEDGYVVSVVDNSNRGEAKYWVEDFLQVKRKNDSFTQTQNAMAMCKSFISQLPSDIDKVDKATMMNRVVDSLKQESVNMDSVAERVFGPEYFAGFNSFRNEYQETYEVRFDDSFQGKPEAIKRRATGTMTTIKLDKNFDVNIHGGEQFIERGYDEEKGMRYYKLYFNEEK